MILVFDTSGSELSVGIADDSGAILREIHVSPDVANERAIHDARLAMETEKLLGAEGMLSTAISRIGLMIGPGSFTGLRIGLSFAKGLAFATGAGIVPLTVHEVLAKEAGFSDATIVTPGYKPDLFYLADAAEPKSVRAVSGEEIKNLLGNIIAHSHFLTQASPFIPAFASFFNPSLRTMAELTGIGTSMIENEIDGLEPLYLTEFNVKKA